MNEAPIDHLFPLCKSGQDCAGKLFHTDDSQ